MNMRLCKPSLIFLLLSLLMGSACSERVEIKTVESKKKASTAWRRVIQKVKSKDGIDFKAVKKNRKALKQYLAYAATHGQHTDSWKESHEDKRLSFLINVHNAMVLNTLLRHKMPDSPDDVKVGMYQWPGAGLTWGTKYKVDSEWTSIGHLALHDTVNRYQEPLLWIALHDGTRDSAPLRWWPPSKLQSILQNETRLFVNSERGMQKTETGWSVNPLFFKHKDDFIVWTQATNLCEWMVEYASGPRKKWLTENVEACPLEQRAANRSVDRRTTKKTTKPTDGQPVAD
jgi:hypothetical protein